MDNKALTLLEILVAVIILALVVTGLAGVFVAGKRYIQRSRSRMTGGELGKYFLDPLQNDVNQSTWDTTSLLGKASASPQTKRINDRDYQAVYDINTVNLPDNLIRAKVTITLPTLD